MRLGGFVVALAALAPAVSRAVEPQAAAEPEPGACRPEDEDCRVGFGIAGLPLLNFNSDTGFGYGLRLVLYDYGPNQKPYRHAITTQFFQTTRGLAHHRLMFDAPSIFGSGWRLEAALRLYSERYSPWYGTGQDSERELDYVTCDEDLRADPDVCASNPEFRGRRYYSFGSSSTLVELSARRPIAGSLQVFGGYVLRHAELTTRYPKSELGQSGDSKLIEDHRQRPLPGLRFNASGGALPDRTAELQIGAVYDSRDKEPAPTSGGFHDVSLRAASPALGGNHTYWGGNATFRLFQQLDDNGRLVVASRLVLDALVGAVPFYHLSFVGGLKTFDAIGGLNSLRGAPRNRFLGKVKLVINLELRWQAATFRPFDHRLDVSPLFAVDAGRVWRGIHDGGPMLAGEVGLTGGLRLAWDENFVVRIDYGRGLFEATNGLYIDFGYLF